MSAKIILEDDWSEYDNRKKKKEDRLFVSCEEKWEKEYIFEKIHKKFPHLNHEVIHDAINRCCNSVPAPRPRKEYIHCVMSRLGFDDNGGGTPPPNPGSGPKNPPVPPANRNVGK